MIREWGLFLTHSFLKICEKFIFLSIFYAVLFSYFAFVMLLLKMFCSSLFYAIVYAEFVVIFASTVHREMILNSLKPQNHIRIKEVIYKHIIVIFDTFYH